ncbi:MAG: carboxypeptidase regulatory-like domain-containing protein [Acidobacteriota bacterium]
MKRIVLLALVIVLFVPAFANGQGQGNAAISGTVTDPSGGVVPGATVIVTNVSTGVIRIVTTNPSGTFYVPSLFPSSYVVTATHSGFEKFSESVTLLADETRAIDIRLVVGSTAQSITVAATTALLNTISPVISQVIDRARVVGLPLDGRNAADLTLLVPGTTVASGHGTTQGTTKQVPGTESISVNGARPNQISYNLDGADNQDLLSNTNDPFPFPDAVQEFSVQTSNFSPQYGENSGAVVNVVSKSGTNHWHGDAFEFVRNQAFNARNFFSENRDPLKRNQFGGTLGGPIKKNRSFIFFGYQHTKISSTIGGQSAVIPTPANLNGDFSNYLSTGPDNPLGTVVQLLDPATGAPIPGNNLAADPNTPINPVALNMSKVLCPNCNETANGTVYFQPVNGQSLNEYDARFDQTLRGQDRLTARAYLARFAALPAFDGKDLLSLRNTFSGDGSTVQSQNYLLSYTWAKSATLVNATYLSFLRTGSFRYQGLPASMQLSQLGTKVFQLPTSQGGYHGFGASGYFGLGSFTGGEFYRNSVDIRDSASWVLGRHTIGFGGDYEHDQSNIRNTDRENGDWNFNSSDYTGNALANFLTGNLYSFTQTSGNYSDQRQNVQGLYVDDKWQFSPRLTLNGGLRWSPQVPMKEIYGRMEEFFPGAYCGCVQSKRFPNAPYGLFFVGDSYNGFTVPPTGEPGNYHNLAPRVGFAFDPPGKHETVFRGGAGMFYYTRLPGLFLNDATIISPFSNRIDLFPPVPAYLGGGLTNPLAGQAAFASAFPERYTLATAPSNIAFPSPVAVFGLQPGVQWMTPTTFAWNFTVERQLRSDVALQMSYVGNSASHLRQDQDLNPAQYIPGETAFNSLSTDARRIYSGFSDIIMNSNSGNSNYNAFQVSLTKRPGPGLPGIFRNLTLLANYTYSKAMQELASNGGITDVGSSKGSGVPYGNPYQFAFDRGPADFNHTHAFVLSYVWMLPTLKSYSNHLVKTVFGNWDWSGIFTRQSSDFLTVLAGTDNSKTGLGSDRVNFLGTGGQLGTGAQQNATPCSASVRFCVPFLNTSLFGLSPVGEFGNIGQGAIAGPGSWQWDMGIFKNFYPMASHESFRVQFRGEFFNTFNHPNFSDPNLSYVGSSFGAITGQSNTPRVIQLALKLSF